MTERCCQRLGREDVAFVLADAADEIVRLRAVEDAAKVVLATFKKDEADGFRSRDRQYAIEILGRVLEPPTERGKR